jgi:cell division protein FtsW (lipid II flippase)
MNYWLILLVEAVLYYVACSLVAKTREDAPGLIRIFIVVLLLAAISGGVSVMRWDFWSSSVIVFILQFIILWIGLGIGLFRTIIAALIVIFLRAMMEVVFSPAQQTPRLFA